MPAKIGKHTLRLDHAPTAAAFASIVSKKEGEGPLAAFFDCICPEPSLGDATWEKAESHMQNMAVQKVLQKAARPPSDIDFIFAGDLLNQCIASTYALREFGIPFLGLYGACSTMAEGLSLAALFVDAGIASSAIAVTGSHFCSAERQFRFPLEYGGQRTPTAQWTVTGAGAVLIEEGSAPPFIRHVCIGSIEDFGITDVSNMGAAMAPAACSAFLSFFKDTGTVPADYDLILTGDLGAVGSQLLRELMQKEGLPLGGSYNDCGLMIYDRRKQDVGAGGSGCGCSASVLCSVILQRLQKGELKNVLFAATGALMSTVSVQQGESIPAIAHLVHLSSEPF